jgi:hypothetical protein
VIDDNQLLQAVSHSNNKEYQTRGQIAFVTGQNLELVKR